MKIIHLISGLLMSAVLLTGCQVDELEYTNPADVTSLLVYGCLADNEETTYPAEIDPEAGTIVVQVPYYISATEQKMGDLTNMKLRAQLPTGARFQPSLSGIHDLTQPFVTTYTDHQGYSQRFEITAAAVKSKEAKITKLYFKDLPNATVSIKEPESADQNGVITVFQTSGAITAAMTQSVIEISAWATIESPAVDPTTGYYDLSSRPQITVVAQNGVDKTTYDVVMDAPKFVEVGKLGYITPLFAMQIYTDNTLGFEKDANKTIAVVGNYLVISNSKDVNNMIVLNRFSGEKVDLKINTQNMPQDRSYYAICSDDAGHLITMTYTSTYDNSQTDPNVRIFAWLNGLENAPTSLLWANINDGYFQNAPVGVNKTTKLDIGYTLNCKGDITNEAVLTTSCKAVPRTVFFQFTEGKIASKAYIEWGGGTVSMWNASNCVPLTTKAPYSYIWHTGNFRQQIMYVPAGTAANRAVTFNVPTSHWWVGCIHGVAYVEFNGMQLLAAINGQTQTGGAHRFYLSNISANPTASSFVSGFLFDSREGDAVNGVELDGGPKGTGYKESGMTSPYTYETAPGKTVLGTNSDEMGSIIFGKSLDDSSVQLYMFIPDQGLIAYELTKFNM